ncbi:hypothetical protein OGAPHI_006282 [Ogataea philodendri]|uniref:Ubiquitin-conjugating enzyme E2 H n=1 Tax=Ogataea philodendri TaxID=1378263 RepID=A0A9P8T128_9ASCO|nr:uncharacterized protein OGAPHI_006282 [Ogataea philodendri]KAH3662101.1 hypothetical protein OGAPHI_006282 [Ogataea philodendri]
MTSITLKADLAAKYVVQNELLMQLLGGGVSEVDGVSLGDVYGQDAVEVLQKWKERLESPATIPTSNEVDSELADLDAKIKQLEQEFLNPSNEQLRQQNNTLLEEYCAKYNKVVYEIKEDEDLDAGMEDNDEAGPGNKGYCLVDDNMQEFYVNFEGPKDSPYEGGLWRIHVELPDQYPYKSPSIGFQNKIFHPNIDESSGSVCLDVINQTWSPMFEVYNIFESFLPQLLNYPNAADPLNGDASSLYMRDKNLYLEKVKMYVKNYADPALIRNGGGEQEQEDSEDSSDADLSSVDEMVGEMDL